MSKGWCGSSPRTGRSDRENVIQGVCQGVFLVLVLGKFGKLRVITLEFYFSVCFVGDFLHENHKTRICCLFHIVVV